MIRTTFFLALSCIGLVGLVFSCTAPQEPVFIGMDNLKVDMISTGRITVTGDAVYHNPNAIGGTLTATSIEVAVNEVGAATIDQNMEIPVPAQSEFRVPLLFNTTPREIFQRDAGGVLGGVVNALVDRKVAIRYKGWVVVNLGGVSLTVPIEHEETAFIK